MSQQDPTKPLQPGGPEEPKPPPRPKAMIVRYDPDSAIFTVNGEDYLGVARARGSVVTMRFQDPFLGR